MNSLLALRAILVTGKGGVGKTTVAAALARVAAASGRRVLCAEIASDADVAHEAGGKVSPLTHALGGERAGDEPADVLPGIKTVLLSPSHGHYQFLRDSLPMKVLADAAMRSNAIRRFLLAAPTFPEMGVLYRLLDLVRAKRKDGGDEHEVIVVDLPATGHALALAQIPSSLLTIIPGGPIGKAVREGLDLLTDASRTGAVVVTLPETLPVSESLELSRGIVKHHIPLAKMIVNRVPQDPFVADERAALSGLLEGSPPLLGSRSLGRIDRARASLERLRGETGVPVMTVNEVWTEGPLVSAEVADLLLGAALERSMPPPSRVA